MKLNYLPAFFLTISFCFCFLFAIAQRPNIGGYNVYYGHLHNHTSVSDGKSTPDQAYNYAKNTAHLDFFSLADHSNMITSTEWTATKTAANKYNQDGVFTAFYGFEWTTLWSYGHVTVIGTEDYCSNNSPTSSFSGLLAWVNARNGIAFFNHPGWDVLASKEFNKFTDTPSTKFVGMELWNDVDGFKKYYYNDGFYSNDGGKNYFDEALMRGWKIGAAGSDDNHVSTWGTRTPWRVGVLATALNRTEILNAFVARRFFSTLDKNLSLSLKVNDAEMGSTVTGGTLELQIMAKDEDTNEAFNKVIIMKNGAVAETIILNPWINNVTINRTLTGVDKDYYYVKVTQTDGDEAISSPVFIQGTANQAPVVAITSPVNNASIGLGVPVNITATAADDGTIDRVEFYEGITKLGEVLSAPYEYTWTPAAGTYSLTAIATDNLDVSTVSAPVSVTITTSEPPVGNFINKRIAAGSDDAEQYSKGAVILGDPALNMVYESKTTGNQTIGLRFTALDIPQGAIITKAYIEFVADKASSGSASFTIRGEDVDNAGEFKAVSKNLSSRVKTTASVSWAPSDWLVVGNPYQSSELKTIVQEIVDRAGWTNGNSMAFLITGTGTRTAESFEGSPVAAPLLHIDYTTTKSGHIKELISKAENHEILVYPNPVTEVLTFRLDEETGVDRILIYSISGRLVKDMPVYQHLIEKQVNCNDLVAGTYLMKITTNSKDYSVKFIKQ